MCQQRQSEQGQKRPFVGADLQMLVVSAFITPRVVSLLAAYSSLCYHSVKLATSPMSKLMFSVCFVSLTAQELHHSAMKAFLSAKKKKGKVKKSQGMKGKIPSN